MVEMFVLGDSAIYYGDNSATHELNDKRLADLNLDESQLYRERLRRGAGYDTQHREILGHLQLKQRKLRNRTGGYWIAEADHVAANHAIIRRIPAGSVAWAVLATDGAYGPLHHLGRDDWRGIAHKSAAELDELLRNTAEWESNEDPTGRKFPRSKVSDDKALVAALFE